MPRASARKARNGRLALGETQVEDEAERPDVVSASSGDSVECDPPVGDVILSVLLTPVSLQYRA